MLYVEMKRTIIKNIITKLTIKTRLNTTNSHERFLLRVGCCCVLLLVSRHLMQESS